MVYLARLTDPAIAAGSFARFDNRMYEVFRTRCLYTARELDNTLERGLAALPPLLDSVLQQIMLPAKHGGGALRSILFTASQAFYSSFIATIKSTQIILSQPDSPDLLASNSVDVAQRCHQQLINEGASHTPNLKWGDVAAPTCHLPTLFNSASVFYENVLDAKTFKLQKLLTAQVEVCRASALIDTLVDPRDVARMACLKKPGASSAQMTLPDPNFPGLVMNNLVYTDFMKLRLGLPPAFGLWKCSCGYDLSLDYTHCLSCKHMAAEHTRRHDALKHLTTRQCNAFGITASNEPSSDQIFAKRLRPDGLQQFPGGSNLTDNTVISALCDSRIKNRTAGTPKPLDIAADDKIKKYNKKGNKNSVAARMNATFYPLAMESHGGMHKTYRKFLQNLALEALDEGLCEESTYNKLLTNLIGEHAVTLARGNSWAFSKLRRRASRLPRARR